MSPRTQTQGVRFAARLSAIDSSTILRLPEEASRQLPSRGQVAVRGTIDGHEFQTVVEPDGSFGHWIKVDRQLERAVGVGVGDSVTLEIEPLAEWPEPTVPADLAGALTAAPPSVRAMWGDITPMARWEWVRWVNATNSPDTRRRRVEVTISKMQSGKRRPCCFNRAACIDASLSKSGKLRQAS